jgi:hypothetical protein
VVAGGVGKADNATGRTPITGKRGQCIESAISRLATSGLGEIARDFESLARSCRNFIIGRVSTS